MAKIKVTYRRPTIIEQPTCGKVDRCKYAVTCAYNWRPVLSGLCFERKPDVKKINNRYKKDGKNES